MIVEILCSVARKSAKMQTLGELRMTRASYYTHYNNIVAIDSMREVSCDFLCLQGTQSKGTRSCANLSCSLAFYAITFERSSYTKVAF